MASVDRLAAVGKGGVARDHRHTAPHREPSQDILGNPVGEVRLLGVVAHVVERQYGDRRATAKPWHRLGHAESSKRADLVGDGNGEGVDRPFDVLEPSFSDVLERHAQIVVDLLADVSGDADAVGRRERLETGGDVHAVPGNVAAIDDNVADVNADAEAKPGFDTPVGFECDHVALNVDAAFQRCGGAGELGQKAITRGLDQAATMFYDLGLDNLVPQPAQPREGQRLVVLHQSAEAGQVGNHDRRQLAFGCSCRQDSLHYRPVPAIFSNRIQVDAIRIK
jgi:hypothetical protein